MVRLKANLPLEDNKALSYFKLRYSGVKHYDHAPSASEIKQSLSDAHKIKVMHIPGGLEIPGITLFLHDLPPNSSQVNGIVVPSGKRGFSNTVAVLLHA